jgi:hypothetical protein
MSAPGSAHSLFIDPVEAIGPISPDLDLSLCADTARAAAAAARTWAAPDEWTGLGGFDAGGGFWLRPLGPEELEFIRQPDSCGWLAGGQTRATSGALEKYFPVSRAPSHFQPPLSFVSLQHWIKALPGFGGCALRHPVTGLWKPIVPPPDPVRFNKLIAMVIPLSRILKAQNLPAGRMILTAGNHAALVWRTPSKVSGYLHLNDTASIPHAAALVDSLLICTA